MEMQNPLTEEQLRQMERDLEEMKIRADEMAALLAAGVGAGDQRAIRAQEVSSAIQRLQWSIERGGTPRVSAAGH